MKKTVIKFETVNGVTIDTLSGKLKRTYYDHNGMLRWQLVETEHDAALEFHLVEARMKAQNRPMFEPNESVFVLPTHWVGAWTAFVTKGDAQPGPPSTEVLVDPESGGVLGGLACGEAWRAVDKWTFFFFVRTYGLRGPVIEFKAPSPVEVDDNGSTLPSTDGAAVTKEDDSEGAQPTH